MYMFVRSGVSYRVEEFKKHVNDRKLHENFDIVYFNEYDKHDTFVKWFHKTIAPHVSIEEVSGLIKYYEIFDKAIKNDLKEFVIVDDDVIFIENWKPAFETQLKFFEIMGLGVNYHVLPGVTSIETGNVGGGECLRCSKSFAEFMLNNIDVSQAIDIVFGAVMIHHGLKLCVTPVCHQTSIIDDKSEQNHNNTKYKIDWITYTNNYKPSGVRYEDVKNEYHKFMFMKKAVEQNFYKTYNKQVDIWNIEFIIKRFYALKHNGVL